MIVAKTYFFFLYFEAQVHFDSRLIVQKLESRFATQEGRHVRDIGLKNKQELTISKKQKNLWRKNQQKYFFNSHETTTLQNLRPD